MVRIKRGEVSVCKKDCNSDWYIEVRSCFTEISRCEINCDLGAREWESKMTHGTFDALARFLDGCIWEADNQECWKTRRDIAFDIDTKTIKADERRCDDTRAHTSTATVSRENVNA